MTDDIVLDVHCPHCGDVELETDQLWLVVATDPARSYYEFVCTSCGDLVTHHAVEAAVDILAPLVAVWHLDIPAEALERHDGPPLTVDDLLDFCLALESYGGASPPEALAA